MGPVGAGILVHSDLNVLFIFSFAERRLSLVCRAKSTRHVIRKDEGEDNSVGFQAELSSLHRPMSRQTRHTAILQ